jgi:ribosomal subunit interface protein
MRIAINVSDADLAGAVHSYVERRLRFALSRFGGRVGQVTVRVSADGRASSRCRIEAELLPFGYVAVEERDSDLFSAIDRATGRIGRLFSRKLERTRESRIGRESVRIAA